MLAKGDPVSLDLLFRSNLVKQELTRLGINSIALLNKMVNVAPDVMRKLRDLLDREVERYDHEWMETSEGTEKRPVAIRSRKNELDCGSIVNQLVSSIPKDVLVRSSYLECQQSVATQHAQEVSVKLISSVTRRFQFTGTKEEYEPSSDCSSGDKNCPRSHAPSDPDRMTCPGRKCRSDQGTKCCQGSRLQSDQGTEFCPGSRETL